MFFDKMKQFIDQLRPSIEKQIKLTCAHFRRVILVTLIVFINILGTSSTLRHLLDLTNFHSLVLTHTNTVGFKILKKNLCFTYVALSDPDSMKFQQ